MQTITVTELQHNLGLYLEKVKDGDEIIIEDKDVIIARITPFDNEEAQLVADGLMRLPKSELPEAFWEIETSEVSLEKIVEIIRTDRDED